MRHLPLALQWAYTDGACGLFALTAARMPGCRDGVVVALEDGDDGFHIAVALPDGRYVDAEGVRTRDDVIAAFGLKRASLHERPWSSDLPPGRHGDRLHELLLSLGWQERLPEDDGRTATSRPKRARTDFERIGGMSSDPVEVIEIFLRRRRRSAHDVTGNDAVTRRQAA